MTDQLAWYKAAVKAQIKGDPLPPISENEPQWGIYFKKASRQGGRIPVRIQEDATGALVAISGTKATHRLEDAANVWTWVAKNVVPDRETYVYAWTQDKWPDGTPTTAVDGPPAMGDNLPTDPTERLLAQVTDAIAGATEFLDDVAAKPDMTRANTARNKQAELLGFKATADAMHKSEKQPHLDAGRAVDDTYRFRESLDALSKRLNRLFTSIAAAEEARLQAEAQKKFEEERAAAIAERQWIEAERAEKMKIDPISALTDPEPELPIIPSKPNEVKVRVGGGIGRAAGLKTVYESEIIDYKATLAHFATHTDIVAAVEKLVKAAVRVTKNETNIPGVKVVEKRKAA